METPTESTAAGNGVVSKVVTVPGTSLGGMLASPGTEFPMADVSE